MSKKLTRKSKDDLSPSPEESDELQMIFDRLAVQDPEGQSFEGYLHSLLNSLSGRPLLAAALIDRLSRNPGLTGFRVFQALGKAVENSPYRRSLKQAAYRFSQKGFSDVKEISAPEKVVLIQSEARKPVSHVFMVMGTLWLVSALVPEAVHGGYSLVTAFVEDDFSTFNVRIAEGSNQKLYREYLQVLSTHAIGHRSFEIPPWHAARLFFEMLDFRTVTKPDVNIERARGIFNLWHDPARKPYVYDLMPPIENPEQYFGEIRIEELLKEMDTSWIAFKRDELSPYYEKMKSLDSPILVVPKEIQAERSRNLLSEAAESLCSGAKRTFYRRFFEEQAMALKLSGTEDRARWAWIIANNLAEGSPIGENPAVSRMILYSIQTHWPEFKPTGETEPAPDRLHRTESGLILP